MPCPSVLEFWHSKPSSFLGTHSVMCNSMMPRPHPPTPGHSSTPAVSIANANLPNCTTAHPQVISLCLNRGSLAADHLSPIQLALAYALPIVPREDHSPGAKGRLGDGWGHPLHVAKLMGSWACEWVARDEPIMKVQLVERNAMLWKNCSDKTS